MDIRTPKEIERDKMDRAVAARFEQLKKETAATDSRIISYIAREGKFKYKSPSGVRISLQRTGTI